METTFVVGVENVYSFLSIPENLSMDLLLIDGIFIYDVEFKEITLELFR
jgi:hypothetical protein